MCEIVGCYSEPTHEVTSPDWDTYYCEECQETGHPTPGTDAWERFVEEPETDRHRIGGVLKVCRKCMEELTGLYGYELVGLL